MFLHLLCLTASISGVRGIYDYHLVRTDSRNMIITTQDYGLLDVNGGTISYHEVRKKETTMDWMCRMLGYGSYNGYTHGRSYEWMENYPIRYFNLDCTGSVVPQCHYQEANSVGLSNSLWLKCNNRDQLGDTSNFYLVDKDKVLTQQGHGLLMYNGQTVSGNKFDDTTAELICRIMGYRKVMSWSTGRKYKFQDTTAIGINNLNCLKSEDVFPLCVYGTSTTEETHDNDIWLWCSLPTYNNYKLVCPPGQRRESSNTCVECAANTYSPEPSESSSCSSCPANSTSPAGSTSCSCSEGTYMSSDGDECLECPGNSTSLKGSTFCTCVSGTYLYSDLSSCVPCPSGAISKEGGTTPGDCKNCPAGSEPINSGQVCSCGKGYGWEWSTDVDDTKPGSCKACPANFYKDRKQGTCTRCPQEATSLPLSEDCQCPSGLSWDGKSCVDCTDQDTSSRVCNCSAGTFLSDDSSQCEPCPKNQFSGHFSTVCSKCPIFTVSVPGSAECTSCPKGYSWKNNTCIECPGSLVGNGTACSLCPERSQPLINKDVCSCDKGYGWEWKVGEDGSCKACPANFYKDRKQGTCTRCPQEATSLPLSEDCQCPSGLSWDGKSCVDCTAEGITSGVCTCSAGTFWNEDSGQCEPCPKNHYSGKFFSECSKCPIFTVSLPESAECTSCPKGYSWENYTCTECPGNHVGNGATCSVCPEGTTPSHDKTICQKPAVDSLSVSSLILCILAIVTVIGIIVTMFKKRRERNMTEDLQLEYQAGSSTTKEKVRGRRCMCPSCPCSQVPKPDLPESAATQQQDNLFADFS